MRKEFVNSTRPKNRKFLKDLLIGEFAIFDIPESCILVRTADNKVYNYNSMLELDEHHSCRKDKPIIILDDSYILKQILYRKES